MNTTGHLPVAAALFVCLTVAANSVEFKDFRDWHAACDNLRNCSAYGFESENSGSGYLRIERGGAAEAPVKITLAVWAEDEVTFKLRFDDPALPGLPDGALTGELNDNGSMRQLVLTDTVSADMLIASIRKAGKIIVTRQDPPGRKESSNPLVSEISMSGAMAALLWIDKQQKRLDTRTALIRKGDKPASAVPPQPRAPTIAAVKPASGPAPAKHPPALIARGRALCGEEDEGSRLEETVPLGGGMFLYMFICPDNSGAYNFNYGLLTGPAGNAQATKPVELKYPVKIGDLRIDPEPQTSATNPSFDPRTMTLSTFAKGRGISDCGSAEDWAWDGKAFRLLRLRMMPHCKGVPLDDWPVLYRADRR